MEAVVIRCADLFSPNFFFRRRIVGYVAGALGVLPFLLSFFLSLGMLKRGAEIFENHRFPFSFSLFFHLISRNAGGITSPPPPFFFSLGAGVQEDGNSSFVPIFALRHTRTGVEALVFFFFSFFLVFTAAAPQFAHVESNTSLFFSLMAVFRLYFSPGNEDPQNEDGGCSPLFLFFFSLLHGLRLRLRSRMHPRANSSPLLPRISVFL